MFIARLFIIEKKRKYPRCPTVEKWLTKLWHIYTKRRVAIKNFIFSIIFSKSLMTYNFYYTIKMLNEKVEHQIAYIV